MVFKVSNTAGVVVRTCSVCPTLMVPDVPHAPPLIEICGDPLPDTLTVMGPSYPVSVTLLDVMTLLVFCALTSVKAKESGVVSCALVVTLQVSSVEPIEIVAVLAVPNEALDVNRTAKVCPFVMGPPLPHAPPLMET
jgi:hypothetical protein